MDTDVPGILTKKLLESTRMPVRKLHDSHTQNALPRARRRSGGP